MRRLVERASGAVRKWLKGNNVTNEIDPYLQWALLPGVACDFAPALIAAAEAEAKDLGDAGLLKAPQVLVGIELADPASFNCPDYLSLYGAGDFHKTMLTCQIARLNAADLGRLTAEPGITSVTVAVNVLRSDQDGGRTDGGNLETVGRFHRGGVTDLPSELIVTNKKVIAIIDHGCPFANDQFRAMTPAQQPKDAPKSRVKLMWDQDPARKSKTYSHWGLTENGFLYGAELQNVVDDDRHPTINKLMEKHFKDGVFDEAGCYDAIDYLVPRRAWSHGAHVMDLAAGWPNPANFDVTDRDAAADADIIFVQLPRRTIADSSGGAMAVYVLDALQYIVERTLPDADVVVNLSFGTFAGPHDGTSFLERAIDEICRYRPKLKVVLPAGNSRNEDCHAQLTLENASPNQTLQLEVMADDPRPTFVELWWSGDAELGISLLPPGGVWCGPVGSNGSKKWPDASDAYECTIIQKTGLRGNTAVVKNSMALIAIAATAHTDTPAPCAPFGIWTIQIESTNSPVTVDAWIERGDIVLYEGWQATQARFVVDPTEHPADDYPAGQPVRKSGTLNAFGAGQHTELVGARYADGSGVPAYASIGPGRNGLRDGVVVEPSYPTDDSETLVGILASSGMGTGVARLSGTSMAAPQHSRELLNRTK